jgi:hypothetical protein
MFQSSVTLKIAYGGNNQRMEEAARDRGGVFGHRGGFGGDRGLAPPNPANV